MTDRWIVDEKTLELSERQPDGSYKVAYIMVPIADVEEGFRIRNRAMNAIQQTKTGAGS